MHLNAHETIKVLPYNKFEKSKEAGLKRKHSCVRLRSEISVIGEYESASLLTVISTCISVAVAANFSFDFQMSMILLR